MSKQVTLSVHIGWLEHEDACGQPCWACEDTIWLKGYVPVLVIGKRHGTKAFNDWCVCASCVPEELVVE